MTSPATPTRTEYVGRGALLALLVIPVGIVVFVLLSSVGIVASIVSFGVAFGAYWLYQRGAGGVITRTGAWVVLVIVVITVVLSLFAGLVWQEATADGSANGFSPWDALGSASFWTIFGNNFGTIAQSDSLNIFIALAFAALGSFRLLRRAFRSTSTAPRPSYPAVPTHYNDVDAPPTGSADDRTPPPATGV